ncbi:MAG TPA: hypothetical protein VHP38_02940 [Ruminiclostridium sp.]|nr:hypothetical protein [Ruminiclostridium sp.]
MLIDIKFFRSGGCVNSTGREDFSRTKSLTTEAQSGNAAAQT